MTTIETAFGGWIERVYLDKHSSIPFSFVFQLPHKLAPSHIRDGFRKLVVLDHVLDLQTLDAYDLVFSYDLGREFMLERTSSFLSYLSVLILNLWVNL